MVGQSSSIEEQPLDTILSWMQENYEQDSNDFHDIALRTISKAQKVGDSNQLGALHEALADWHGYHGFTNEDSILVHDYRALEYFEQTGNKEDIARVLSTLSIDLLNAGDLEKSQESTYKAIGLFDELGDKGGIANCHRSLTYLFDRLGENDKALDYGIQAYDYYKEVDDYDKMSYTLLSLIGTYQSLEQYDKAQAAAQECIDLVNEKIPNQVFVLSRAYGYKGDVSLTQGKLDQALAESKKAYAIASEHASPDRAASYRIGIGDVLKVQNRCNEAIDHYQAAIVQSLKQGQHYQLSSVYKSISECYQETGKLDSALSYFQKHADVKIHISQEEVANLESEAVIKYETGKKDEALSYQKIELERRKKNQNIYLGIVAILASLLGGLVYMYIRNKKINQELEIKIDENEILMKEVHHRVKNNLQILSSLLSLQSDDEEDLAISGALQESRNRVESMGLIHQKLYTRDNLSAIDMKDYIKELVDYLQETFTNANHNIRILSDVSIGLMDVESAIPIGLIVNELVTNSVKYGGVEISINLENTSEGLLSLVVSDNGTGSDIENSKASSTNFGSQLIKILSKKLKGEIEVDRSNGYSTLIQFRRFKLIS